MKTNFGEVAGATGNEEESLRELFTDPDPGEDLTTLMRRTELQNDVLLRIKEQLDLPSGSAGE